MNDFGQVCFLHATKTSSWKVELYKPEECMGFPVRAIARQENDQFIIHDVKNQNKTGLFNVQSKMVTSHIRFHSASKHYNDNRVKISAKGLYFPNYWLLKNNTDVILLHPDTLEKIRLQLDWDLNDIAHVQQMEQYFLLTHAHIRNKNKDSLKALITPYGKIILVGYDMRILDASIGHYLYCDGYVYTSDGHKVIDEKSTFANIVFYGKTECIALHCEVGEEKSIYKLYDLQGHPVSATESFEYFFEGKEIGFNQYRTPDGYFLRTPHGVIKGGRQHGSNGHPSRDIDDLIVVSDYQAKQERILTPTGYPFFSESIPQYHEVLRQHVLHIRASSPLGVPATLSPLPLEKLLLPRVLDNMVHLNQLALDAFQYGLCLRFIEWPSPVFQLMVPYASIFTYTAAIDQANEYQTIIRFSESLSAEAGTLILSLFNLLNLIRHELPFEPVAQKLITVLEIYGLGALTQLYQVLQENHCKLRLHGAEFSYSKAIIDELPSLAGQLCYYLFYPEQCLLHADKTPIFTSFITKNTLSLLDFMCAYQFDCHILSFITTDLELFLATVKSWGDYADKSHFTRVIQHAIYHQADPNKHLYEREFLQNALDAYAANQTDQATVDVLLYEENGHCVFRLKDEGIGMSLEDIFRFYCLPGASAKRSDQHQSYIGGHGVGAFTAFHNADYIRIKTGQNQGHVYHFILTPVYSVDNKIVDIHVCWEIQPGYFKGTVVERIARGTQQALDAARHLRTFKSHAKTVDANVATIRINGEVINQPLIPLACVEMPEVGQLKLYQSIEDMITVSGLSVKPIDDMDRFIPEEIRNIVRKQGLIIELPKQLPLNRERTDFIDAESVYEFLKPYVLSAYIEAYIKLFLTEKIALSELPYDFFTYFEHYTANMMRHNPDLVQDADNICHNRPIKNYQIYQHLPRLHELLAHLPLFKQDNKSKREDCEIKPQKYSLVALADYYNKHKRLPENLITPLFLTHFAKRYTNEWRARERHKECAFGLDNVPEVDWVAPTHALPGDWQVLVKITRYIAQRMGHDIQVGFSTLKNGSLMHTNQRSNTIYWNVYSVADSSGLANKLFNALRENTLTSSDEILEQLYNVISHELTHAILEDQHTNTHNRTFYIKQRKILTLFAAQVNHDQLISDIQSIFTQNYQQVEKYHSFDWMSFVKAQLLTQETLGYIQSLFTRKREYPEAFAGDELHDRGGKQLSTPF